MESLNNYITGRIIIAERIRIDNIKTNNVFPVDGNQYDVVDFLERNGFDEIKDMSNLPLYTDYIDFFNRRKDRCFGIKLKGSSSNQFICFADTSKDKISKSNMLYIINFDPETLNPVQYVKIWTGNIYGFILMNKNEFKKEMESYFK